MIKDKIIQILINPYNGEPISVENDNCLVDQSGNKIPVENGIPNFLALEHTDGLNKKFQLFYDKISRMNDLAEIIYGLFYDLNKLRTEWMSDVEVRKGWKILETSIGTGWNVKVLPDYAEYYGLDISKGMLYQCSKNRKKWKREIELFQGNAEYLPFKSEIFDSVFHVGGINFFNDRKRAIEEMIRVAKEGTRIVVIDETEERVAKQYRKTPFVGKFFRESNIDMARTVAPVDLIPENMTEIEVKLLDKGKMYQLSFRKP
jgi:ubiquinone/menaquinone biosynthesis C-methylase UbiE